MNKIDKYLHNLSWNVDEKLQRKAIDKLSKVNAKEVGQLIMPLDKDCWDNASKVISCLNDDIIEPIIPELLVWLQDMNWPGSLKLVDRLLLMDYELLQEKAKLVIEQAIKENDLEWKENLEFFILNQ